MRVEKIDIRKSPVASSMDFKRWPVFAKHTGWLRIEWLYWIWNITW